MKSLIGLLIVISLMGSGCLEMIVTEKVPVLYVNITLEDDPRGLMRIKEISARGDEITKLQAPEGEYPGDYPAYYVAILQGLVPVSFNSGKDYTGPGNYHYAIGLKPEFNKSEPLVISGSGIDKNGTYISQQSYVINWSTDIRNKTFKYD